MLLALLMTAMALAPPPVPALRNAVFDGYQRLLPRERVSDAVVIVAIDEPSLAALGQWPWPRARLADLITGIHRYQPAVIGLDLLFPEADRFSPAMLALTLPVMPTEMAEKLRAFPSGDATFAAAIVRNNVVLGMSGTAAADPRFPLPPQVAPLRFSTARDLPLTTYPGHTRSLDEIDRAAAGRGFLNGLPQDGIVRRAPLLAKVQDVLALSLSVEMLRVLSRQPVRIADRGGAGLAIQLGELSIPADDDGTTWIRYSPHDPARFVSAADVLSGKVDPAQLRDKLVLVGVTGLGLLDYQVTALRDVVPGVEIHAQLIEQFFEQRHLQRPDLALLFEVLLLGLAGIVVIALAPRFRVQRTLAAFLGGCIALFGVGLGLFYWQGVLIDVAWPVIGTLAVLGMVLAGTLAESDRQRLLMREQAARMAGELDAGKRIQTGLLPNPAKIFAGEQRFTVAAVLEPARTVGGDFYDCFMLDADRLFFVVADVSGKGLPAALFMAAAKSQIKSAVLSNPGDLAAAIQRAQWEIARENPESLFVTLFAGVLNAADGRFCYVNAGHDAPHVGGALEGMAPPPRPPRPSRQLPAAAGPPLCVIDDFPYAAATDVLAPGEWLCVMTDGVTEATSSAGTFFGGQRVRDAFARLPEPASADAVVQCLVDAVHTFAAGADPADDLTLLVVGRADAVPEKSGSGASGR